MVLAPSFPEASMATTLAVFGKSPQRSVALGCCSVPRRHAQAGSVYPLSEKVHREALTQQASWSGPRRRAQAGSVDLLTQQAPCRRTSAQHPSLGCIAAELRPSAQHRPCCRYTPVLARERAQEHLKWRARRSVFPLPVHCPAVLSTSPFPAPLSPSPTRPAPSLTPLYPCPVLPRATICGKGASPLTPLSPSPPARGRGAWGMGPMLPVFATSSSTDGSSTVTSPAPVDAAPAEAGAAGANGSVAAAAAEAVPSRGGDALWRQRPGEAPSRGGNIYVDPKNIIMLQAFNWDSPKSGTWWNKVKESVGGIRNLGATDVWLPPPSQSVDLNGYMPSELLNLNASHYGNEAELKALIDALHEARLRVLADIVINHRCGEFQDTKGNWTIFEGGTPDERLDWGPWAITAGDLPYGGEGGPDTGADYPGAPDIDHTNPRVQEDLTFWLRWLKEDIGFDGWRLDFVKGYGGEFAGLYCDRTQPVFAVGEYWADMRYDSNGALEYNQDANRQILCDWIDKTGGRCAAFDFSTKGILQEAFKQTEFWRLRDRNGKPPGLMGWWPSKAVTFIENHDTGPPQKHWPFPAEKVMAGYAYILTHPGVPCIFWDHAFVWGLEEKIAQLVDLRKRNGLNAESALEILVAERDLYMAKIGGKVVLKIGPRYDIGRFLPDPSSFQVAAYGDWFAVWEQK